MNITIYESIEQFFAIHKDKQFAFLSSHGKKTYWDIDFKDETFLVFGKESVGLPKTLTEKYPESIYKIPLYSEHVRSLNLANAVSIVVYEGLKQLTT